MPKNQVEEKKATQVQRVQPGQHYYQHDNKTTIIR